MPSTDDTQTSDTAVHDADVMAEFARRSREVAQQRVKEAAGTDEYRAIGAIVSIRPRRPT